MGGVFVNPEIHALFTGLAKLEGASLAVSLTVVWAFATSKFDLTFFSLVLEHIENLDPVFKHLSEKMQKDGYV
ncbi:MAG: hypothetical protein ACOYN4_01560 [Bacteroidales bacterium]